MYANPCLIPILFQRCVPAGHVSKEDKFCEREFDLLVCESFKTWGRVGASLKAKNFTPRVSRFFHLRVVSSEMEANIFM